MSNPQRPWHRPTDPGKAALTYSATDALQYQEMQRPVWLLDYLQTSAGGFGADKQVRVDGESVFYREHHSGTARLRGELSEGLMAVAVVNEYGQRGRWWGSDYPKHTIPFTSSSREIDLVLPTDYVGFIFALPKALLVDSLGLLTAGDQNWLNSDANFLELAESSIRRLEERWSRIFHDFERESFCDDLIGCLATELPANPRAVHCLSPKTELVRKATDLYEGNQGRISISQLCLQLRVSQRSLLYAFHSVVGVSPSHYFKLTRLAKAHQKLVESNPAEITVAQIARDCGIGELGRFSVEYRKQFGESPSTTLKRQKTVVFLNGEKETGNG